MQNKIVEYKNADSVIVFQQSKESSPLPSEIEECIKKVEEYSKITSLILKN